MQLYHLGYKGVFCNCRKKQFIIDNKGKFVSELYCTTIFREVVELHRFETRCGMAPIIYWNF